MTVQAALRAAARCGRPELGPSAEVDVHLACALEHVTDSHREHAVLFDAWVRECAASVSVR